jgi:hypothetical protein
LRIFSKSGEIFLHGLFLEHWYKHLTYLQEHFLVSNIVELIREAIIVEGDSLRLRVDFSKLFIVVLNDNLKRLFLDVGLLNNLADIRENVLLHAGYFEVQFFEMGDVGFERLQYASSLQSEAE